jgi:hypothetical protein
MVAKLMLVRSNFIEGEESYHAVIEHIETLTQKDLLDEMEWHSSTLTKTDMLAFLESHERAIIRALLKGKRVVTNLIHYQLSVKGVFTDPDDSIEEGRHNIGASVSPGPVLKREINNNTVAVEKQAFTKPKPRLDSYTNLHNSDPDTVLSPTYMARLRGDKLGFDMGDPEQGLFLMPQTNGSDPLANPSAIRIEDVARLTNREIIFRVPDSLPAGLYRLEVRRRFGQNSLRTGMLDELLTVS